MKHTYVSAGIVALLIVAIAAVATVAATINLELTYQSNSNKIVWRFNTNGQFSGKEIVESSIVAVYWLEDGIEHTVTPGQIITTNNHVALVFDSTGFPDHASGARVTGQLINGNDFLATGPGFTWGRR